MKEALKGNHKNDEYYTPLYAIEPLFRKYGIDLLVLDKRVEFMENKSNWFNTSWFTWHILPKALIFEELKKEA